MGKTTDMIILHTYKKDTAGNVIEGESKPYFFNRVWVGAKIAPHQTVVDFLNEYTYDDTEWLLEEAVREGNVIVKA